MRHSDWFGKILKNAGENSVAQSDRGAQIGLYRFYRGKLFILPLGQIILERISHLFEGAWSFLPSLKLPAAGSRLDWAAVLAGEIKSYTELPVWIKVLGGRNWFSEGKNIDLQKQDLTERYACVDKNKIVEEAGKWRKGVNDLLSTLELQNVHLSDTPEQLEWFLEDRNGLTRRLNCSKCSWLGRGEYHPVNFKPDITEADPGLSITLIETPGVTTIEDLASFVGATAQDTIKSVFLETDEGVLIQTLIRGDRDVSKEKVGKLLGIHGVKVASTQSLQRIGVPAGYAGPVLNNEFHTDKTLIDQSITTKKNYIAGANKEGWHLSNIRPGRDFDISPQGDISTAVEDDTCAFCGGRLENSLGRVLASWSSYMNLFSLSGREGKRIQIGLGMGTLEMEEILNVLAEQCARKNQMHWPVGITPFNVYLISIREDDAAEKLYRDLTQAGVTIFYDNRDVNPGVKFNDSDLMGCRYRITVSSRSIKNGGAEILSLRKNQEQILSMDKIVDWICLGK